MGLSVVALMRDRWFGDFMGRKHNLMRAFSRDTRVGTCVYVEPVLPVDESQVTARPLWSERLAWGRCPIGFVREIESGRLYALAPTEGFQYDLRCFRDVLSELGVNDFILWAQSPLLADVATQMEARALIYDCTDDYTTIHPHQAAELAAGDALLLDRADVVTTVSRRLYEQKSARRASHLHMLSCAADTAHFDPARHQEAPAELLPYLDRPIVGYMGKINYKLDVELMGSVCRMLPQMTFVFVGPVMRDVGAWSSLPNVVFTGVKDYDRLPAYLRWIDVCIIPHELNSITRYMNPIKVYEYLAMGKPVVSTPIEGLDDVRGQLLIHLDEIGRAHV